MNLCTSLFVYVGSIGLYKRIVNADTQSIRIANADGQVSNSLPLRVLPLIQEGELFFLCFSMVYINSSSWIRGGGFNCDSG